MHKSDAHKPSSLAVQTDRAFVECINLHGPLSRAAIAHMTGISKPTVSESAQRLLEKEIIVECQEVDTSRSKRPAVLYDLNPNKGGYIALSLDQTNARIVATNLQGTVLYTHHQLYIEDRDQSTFIADCLKEISQAKEALNAPLLGMTLSLANPVHPQTGSVVTMQHSPFPLAEGVDFANLLSETFNCSISIDNDVNWATLAEQKHRQLNNFLYVFLGRGIGCGLFFEQVCVRGVNGLAGEIGYLPLLGSKSLLEERYSNEFYQDAKFDKIAADHPIFADITHAIKASCLVIDPECIVLGGPLIHKTQFAQCLQEHMKQHLPLYPTLISRLTQDPPLTGAELGARQLAFISLGLIGAESAAKAFGYHKLVFCHD